MGDKVGRIHMGKQDLNQLQTRKMKGLKRSRDVVDDEEDFVGGDDEIMQDAGKRSKLSDDSMEPTRMLDAERRDRLASDGITRALDALDARSRRIVEERWLKVRDDGSGGMTLHELAAEYGVSAERIRQIESAAMKKMKTALVEYA